MIPGHQIKAYCQYYCIANLKATESFGLGHLKSKNRDLVIAVLLLRFNQNF